MDKRKLKRENSGNNLSKQTGEMPIGQVLIIAFVTIPLVIALMVFSEGAIDYLATSVDNFLNP